MLTSILLIWENNPVYGCSVCFVPGDSSSATALKMGVATLLFVLLGVLGSLAVFFLQVRKRQTDIRISGYQGMVIRILGYQGST